MSDLWDEQTVADGQKILDSYTTKTNLLSEITYLLYRLQQLGEEPDRIRAYRDKIEQMLEEL